MQTQTAAIDHRVHAEAFSRDTAKSPVHLIPVASGFIQAAEDVLLSIVPEYGFAKNQSERHLVD
jgi:hypothetical protein